MDDLEKKLRDLIAEKLDVALDTISNDSRLREDLGADSLDTYELLYAINENLGVKIPDEKAIEFETVGDALKFIKSELE